MSAEEAQNPVLSGVHIAQEPMPESPFSSARLGQQIESPFSQHNGEVPTSEEPIEQRVSARPAPVASALKTAGSGGGDPTIGSPRVVSWDDANLSIVREYEVSETQESTDWDGCKCCCLQ